ncbi:hypothetical protein [Jatrophihabitans sp.]|uniref:hypothetical protein n=1 Tax=Jatrophihabitans sp. TaxID=1932789 RepID=UPI0030C6E924|nr:hypothetical protein [Jatrophihabitans sp.]
MVRIKAQVPLRIRSNGGGITSVRALMGRGATGATGPTGPTGPPGGSDAAFAGWISDTTPSATRTAALAAADVRVAAAIGVSVQAYDAELDVLATKTVDTDGTLAANSDSRLATQKAVKTYADALLDANNAYQYKGVIDCSANPNYPAASAGHTYKVSVAGKIGGASGVVVEVGDSATCLVDATAAGTQAAVGANWIVLQTNIDGAVVGPASATSGRIATFSGTTGKIIADGGVAVSDLTNATTAFSSGTVPQARLGTGSAGAGTKFLADDQTYKTLATSPGDFSGPASSVADNLVGFSGTGGKTGKDSGVAAAAVVTLTGSQTLTNKTLTSPVVNSPTGITATNVGLGNVANLSTLSSRLTGSISRSNAGPATTGMSVTLASSTAYRIRVFGTYQSSSATNGIVFQFGGTATATAIRAWLNVWGQATSVSTPSLFEITAMSSAQTTANVFAANTNYKFEIEGIIRVNAGGTFQLEYAGETASAVTIQADAFLLCEEIA